MQRWLQFGFYAFLLGCATFLFSKIVGGINGGFISGMNRKAGL